MLVPTYGQPFAAAAETPNGKAAALVAQKAELELIAAQEAVKSAKSDRIWTAVAGLVGVASLVVSIVALRRGQ